MKKSAGYILAGLGVLSILLSFPKLRELLKITLPSPITDLILTMIGVILAGIGAFMLSKGSYGKMQEVPIYHDKKIVGYRVIKQK
jgi:glycopeptide antibiotics resistance protein